MSLEREIVEEFFKSATPTKSLSPVELGKIVRGLLNDIPTKALPDSGEIRLMQAILEDAVDEYLKYCGNKGRKEQNLLQELKKWFNSYDVNWPCSFVNICSVLNLDPDYLRQGLARYENAVQNNNPMKYRG